MASGRERDIPESGLACILYTIAVVTGRRGQVRPVAEALKMDHVARVLADDDNDVGARLDRLEPGDRQDLTNAGESRHVLGTANQLARDGTGESDENTDENDDNKDLDHGKTARSADTLSPLNPAFLRTCRSRSRPSQANTLPRLR